MSASAWRCARHRSTMGAITLPQVNPLSDDQRRFAISSAEMKRRAVAFDRLCATTLVATALFTAGSLADSVPAYALGLLALVLLLLACRTALARSFRRFRGTTWTVTATSLVRADDRSRDEYPLTWLRRLRAKRTCAGGIREIRIDLDGRRSVYVNGLEEPEAFEVALLSACPRLEASDELREWIDFDHPLFYVFVGTAVGLTIALALRLVRSGLDARYAYAALAAYALGLGTYWLAAKPLSGRYGARSVVSDYALGAGLVCLAVAAAAAVLG